MTGNRELGQALDAMIIIGSMTPFKTQVIFISRVSRTDETMCFLIQVQQKREAIPKA